MSYLESLKSFAPKGWFKRERDFQDLLNILLDTQKCMIKFGERLEEVEKRVTELEKPEPRYRG